MTNKETTERYMLNKAIVWFLAILILSLTALAQATHEETVKRKELARKQKAEMQMAIQDSESAKRLKLLVDSGNSKSILEASETRDQSLLPYLRIIASNEDQRTRRESAAFYAHIALARFEESGIFDEILREIDSDNNAVQDAGISKLTLISSKAAYRRLFKLLDDFKDRQSSDGNPDIAWGSKSRATMSFLSQTVANPPTGRDRYNVEAWKAWFAKNKHLID